MDFSLNHFLGEAPGGGGPKLVPGGRILAGTVVSLFCAHAAEVRHDSVCPGHLLTLSRCPGTRDLGSRPERLTVLPLVRAAPNVVRIHGRHGWQKALWLRPGSPTGTSSSLLTLSLPGPEFHSLRRAPSAALHQGLPQQSGFHIQGPAQALNQKDLVVALRTEATPKVLVEPSS